MTKKRFIKKLMGAGISRNKATELAKMLPVGEAYKSFLGYAFLIGAMRDVGISAKKAAKGFSHLSRAVQDIGVSANHLGNAFTYVFADELSLFPPPSLPSNTLI